MKIHWSLHVYALPSWETKEVVIHNKKTTTFSFYSRYKKKNTPFVFFKFYLRNSICKIIVFNLEFGVSRTGSPWRIYGN